MNIDRIWVITADTAWEGSEVVCAFIHEEEANAFLSTVRAYVEGGNPHEHNGEKWHDWYDNHPAGRVGAYHGGDYSVVDAPVGRVDPLTRTE